MHVLCTPFGSRSCGAMREAALVCERRIVRIAVWWWNWPAPVFDIQWQDVGAVGCPGVAADTCLATSPGKSAGICMYKISLGAAAAFTADSVCWLLLVSDSYFKPAVCFPPSHSAATALQ